MPLALFSVIKCCCLFHAWRILISVLMLCSLIYENTTLDYLLLSKIEIKPSQTFSVFYSSICMNKALIVIAVSLACINY